MNGQYTVLTFYEGEAPPAQGVVSGVLRDHAGVPQPGWQISLTGGSVTRSTTTGSDGRYKFDGLPAGSYTLSVVGADVTESVQSDGLTPVTLDLTLPPPPSGDWIMEVQRGSGLPLITASMPEAGIQVTITDPFGNSAQVMSGSKPEYGVGGWEVYATNTGTYTIQFLDQTFTLPMSGQYTQLTFKRGVQIQAQAQARLVSKSMPFPQADTWLQSFESHEQTQGLFTLEEL